VQNVTAQLTLGLLLRNAPSLWGTHFDNVVVNKL
jgi:hypothetical protein